MKKKLSVFLAAALILASGCSTKSEDTPGKAYNETDGLSKGEVSATAEPDMEYAYRLDSNKELYLAPSSEGYLKISENSVVDTSENAMLTFSLKVDTAAYNNVKRYIDSGQLPPSDAVRTEELINYFDYDGELLFTEESPFAIYAELGPSVYGEGKHMAFIRVKTADFDRTQLPPSNLTFLIDTSGSMDSYDKLPLLKSAFRLLVENLGENDTVSLVTYAGSSEIVLDSISGDNQDLILNAIETLSAGGSTAGADGINTAYSLCEKNYKKGGNNRVILATDGDFNVGISDLNGLNSLISGKRESGVFLSVLGFGTGNVRDDIMETLSKNGNGNYSYIDSVQAAGKVLVKEAGTNLFTVANDVKAQIEFNPELVKSYRLIGYENRMMNNEDFLDDKKDAGEIGIGTDVVVMFELELLDNQDTLASAKEENCFDVRIRYKDPGNNEAKELTHHVTLDRFLAKNTSDFVFASSVAAFGDLLRDSAYSDGISLGEIADAAQGSKGIDTRGYRGEFVKLVNKAKSISK